MFCSTKARKFSSNPGNVNFEGLVQLLIYIRDNNNFDPEYFAKIEDATISDLLRYGIIKNENQLVVFSDPI